MGFSKVLVVNFAFHVFSFVAVQASTHMPNVEEPTMAPEIAKVLQNKYTSESCLQLIRGDGAEHFNTLKNHIVKSLHLNIPPCNKCQLIRGSLEEFSVNNVELAKLSEDTTIIQATIGFNKIHGYCSRCTFSDDSGVNQSGSVNLIDVHPRFNITLTRKQLSKISEDHESVVVFFTRVEDGKDIVQAKCHPPRYDQQNVNFVDVCNKAHASGELDHVMQYTIEKIFLNEQISSILPKQEDTHDLNEMFPCNYWELDDLVKVSN